MIGNDYKNPLEEIHNEDLGRPSGDEGSMVLWNLRYRLNVCLSALRKIVATGNAHAIEIAKGALDTVEADDD